jgi:diacylglycerol kinase family enzyme
MDLQDIINSLLSKDMKTDNLYHFHTGKVTLASEEKIPWTLDGESGGVHQLVTINDEQQAISIIVPDKNRIED